MTESGHGVQIVNITETESTAEDGNKITSHSFALDEYALEKILLDEKVKNLPVVVVSVAGAYRTGKSFLLNFFIRYLKSKESDRQDGSWLGDDSQPLVGFKWRPGSTRTTTGILIWSEPFIMTQPSGKQVAVIVMDTQGTFDNTSTVRDNSTIFALSTLLSSVQIYNLSSNIQEDDLQNLQLFTEYGKLVTNKDEKAFQVLEFLVRDWQCPQDYSYGAEGGEKLLLEKLKIDPSSPKELQELRRHIQSSFEKLSCFLMPHPGFEVLEPDYNGSISDIRRIFRTHLIDLVKSLFGPEKLLPKTIHGDQVKAKDLCQYFKTYVKLYTSDELPNPTSIMKATVETGFLLAYNEARDVYENGMDKECGPKQLSVPAAEVPLIHKKNMALARAFFVNKKKMGSATDANEYLEKLTEELDSQLSQFAESNLSKILKATIKANEAYDTEIQSIAGDNPLCVHTEDLLSVHNRAVIAALELFDGSRKRLMILEKDDDERNQFKMKLKKKYDLFSQTNEQNNKQNIAHLTMEYSTIMQAKAGQDPPLSEKQFKQEHEKSLKNAVEVFESKRNIHSNYVKDAHKFCLIEEIEESFKNMQKLNTSKNAEAIKLLLNDYKKYMNDVWDHLNNPDTCLYPSELEIEHHNGMCEAIHKYRPNKLGWNQMYCAAEFDNDDKGEKLLKELIEHHYNQLKKLNESANESAVTSAYNKYTTEMSNECGFSIWWVLTIGIAYLINKSNRESFHKTAKSNALSEFDGRRRQSGRTGSIETHYNDDVYRNNLEQIINVYYVENYKYSEDEYSIRPPGSTTTLSI